MPQNISERTTFTYEQAAAMVPELRRLTKEACLEVEALVKGGQEGDAEARINEVVRRWAEAIAQRGLEVKGLWLVDFDNGSGYYCWRYPEERLMYYHSYEEGFGGRLRIQ